VNPPPAAGAVELDDIQGLVRFAYKHHTEAVFLLLRVRDAGSARAWLAHAAVTNAATQTQVPNTALQVGLTSEGLRALGVADEILEAFSPEFIDGMAGDTSRSRRLGDQGLSEPSRWLWGAANRIPHVGVLLYALPGLLNELQQTIEAQLQAGFEIMHRLVTSDMGGIEPFGFVDGISQPELDWQRQRPARDATQTAYLNLSCLGEFLLGYPNEYGLYTTRPLIDPARDSLGILPRAEDAPERSDLGRNGTYLVMRQLRQDVYKFWQALGRYAGGTASTPEHLASAMVGRRLNGEPMVNAGGSSPISGPSASQVTLNDFTYLSDPEGTRCPLGAHIRRTNPRNADVPPGSAGIVSRLARTLGFNAQARDQDLVASTRFHRLLRRGREYGVAVTPAQALTREPLPGERGLQFICLGANIQRQFEFVQSAWITNAKFNGLRDEADPLLGNRLPSAPAMPTDCFSLPQANGPQQRLTGLPQFVTVLGGAYFFLPGIRALRFLSGAPS
jgi:deferrochelatase/peroxidase EfeB